MKRLTIRNSDGTVSQPINTTVEAVFYRLAAYEDTGLEPEEVERCKLTLMGKSLAEITEFDGVTIQRWISVEEEKPKPETEVWILAQHGNRHIITTGMYEDGKQNTEDSCWFWYEHDFEYDEEHDYYIIPEGWWEYKHYNGDDEYNHLIDDVVTHWMPLPEPPKGE